MKASAGQIRGALAKPGGDIRLYLLHGPDEAGASDLARVLAKAMGADAERVDLDGSTLKSDPGRLTDEAASLSLFAGARFVRVASAGEESLEAFTNLLTAERVGNPVVAIAPTVKSTAKIVKLAIDSPARDGVRLLRPNRAGRRTPRDDDRQRERPPPRPRRRPPPRRYDRRRSRRHFARDREARAIPRRRTRSPRGPRSPRTRCRRCGPRRCGNEPRDRCGDRGAGSTISAPNSPCSKKPAPRRSRGSANSSAA
ncbi:hypothetical protein [Sphingomonas sp. H160509]|uniref:hypothetical protein n=1 Tax=Sphingomonas sp. H160509 TaxID=2955313 RepID=UPI003158643E